MAAVDDGGSARRSDELRPQTPGEEEGGEAPLAEASGYRSAPKAKARFGKETPAAIDLKGVTRTFGAFTAVNDVTFEVPEGCVFGLIGPNGAGKTTTFSMLAGYLAPTRGEIFVLDRSPDAITELKGKVGVLPQDALLPSGERVGEFLVYLARLQGMTAPDARRAAEEVLAEVDGRDWWKTPCNALSHGMAKRVGLAQALLGDPRVVLLDEPTAGLDPRVAYEVRQLVKARKGRCTLVISSHNLQELEEICDYAAILDRGQLVALGTMAELTSSSSEVRFTLAHGPVPGGSDPRRRGRARRRLAPGRARAGGDLRPRRLRRGGDDPARHLRPLPERRAHQRDRQGARAGAAGDGADGVAGDRHPASELEHRTG